MAPMEGITDYIYRNTYRKYYGGVDKYFTPFLSPTSDKSFTTREKRNFDPALNDVKTVVPQLITCHADHFIWGMEQIAKNGFGEVNLNLGCPSGTVVAKKKGSGFLAYPLELDEFLYEVFNAKEKLGIEVSIKTRLGKNDPDEFYHLLEIFNKYPIYELTIHPRIQSDFYKYEVKTSYFDYAYKNSKNPLVFNGDITTREDIENTSSKYPSINALMIGRGFLMCPGFNMGESFDLDKFKSFHDDLFSQYEAELSGETPLLWRMKELWAFWGESFDQPKKIKALRKCQRASVYKDIVSEMLIAASVSYKNQS